MDDTPGTVVVCPASSGQVSLLQVIAGVFLKEAEYIRTAFLGHQTGAAAIALQIAVS
jgi:hypothetical protein